MEWELIRSEVANVIERRAVELAEKLSEDFSNKFREQLIVSGVEMAKALNRTIRIRQQIAADKVELVIEIPIPPKSNLGK